MSGRLPPAPGTRAVTMLCLAVAVAGCVSGAPIIAGEARAPLAHSSRPLSREEIGNLRAWLHEHRSGWTPLLETAPPASFVVVFQQASGRESHLELFAEDGWKTAVVWGEGDARTYLARFPGDEVANLRSFLHAPAPPE